MSIIDHIMQLDIASWVAGKIGDLPERARYRAYSAIRSLEWANRNYEAGMSIPATYFALHASEEAVAAFVSCAKVCGYGEDAKLNLRDHMVKAIASLLAQKVSNLLAEYKLGLAVDAASGALIARYEVNGSTLYAEASTDLFHFTHGDGGARKADFMEELTATFKDIGALKKAVLDAQNTRNKLLYATSTGLPTGFLDPEGSLRRECQLTLGLIWGAIDMVRHEGEPIPFVTQALRTANLLIAEMKTK